VAPGPAEGADPLGPRGHAWAGDQPVRAGVRIQKRLRRLAADCPLLLLARSGSAALGLPRFRARRSTASELSAGDVVTDFERGLLWRALESAFDAFSHAWHQDAVAELLPALLGAGYPLPSPCRSSFGV
jgi:hypothetical protein